MNVFALTASSELTGPCRALFQLARQTEGRDVNVVLGIFLLDGYSSSLAIDEARRRGYSVEVLVQRRRYDLRLLYQTWKVLRRHRISILQSHGYKAALIAWLLRRVTRLPWIAFAEGYTSENRRMALYNRLDQWLLRRADRVIAVSQATGALLEGCGVPTDRVVVIPNAIDPAEYDLGADGLAIRRAWGVHADDRVVGVVGRFSPEKGQAIFLQAFRKICDRVPRARAVLVGEGPDERQLRTLVGSYGLEAHVIFAGYEPRVSTVYAALDLVVIPSLSEGLPLVLLEALLHGKALVATAVGGIPDILHGPLAHGLVPPGNVDRLAEAMVTALEQEERWVMFRTLGPSHVRRVSSPEERAEKVFALYETVGDGTGIHTRTRQSPRASDPNCSQV